MFQGGVVSVCNHWGSGKMWLSVLLLIFWLISNVFWLLVWIFWHRHRIAWLSHIDLIRFYERLWERDGYIEFTGHLYRTDWDVYRQDKLGLQCNINNSIINVSIQSDRLSQGSGLPLRHNDKDYFVFIFLRFLSE